MVVWAPKRMELFSIASTSKDYVDFYQHLAVHEFRHVVQTDKINSARNRVNAINKKIASIQARLNKVEANVRRKTGAVNAATQKLKPFSA